MSLPKFLFLNDESQSDWLFSCSDIHNPIIPSGDVDDVSVQYDGIHDSSDIYHSTGASGDVDDVSLQYDGIHDSSNTYHSTGASDDIRDFSLQYDGIYDSSNTYHSTGASDDIRDFSLQYDGINDSSNTYDLSDRPLCREIDQKVEDLDLDTIKAYREKRGKRRWFFWFDEFIVLKVKNKPFNFCINARGVLMKMKRCSSSGHIIFYILIDDDDITKRGMNIIILYICLYHVSVMHMKQIMEHICIFDVYKTTYSNTFKIYTVTELNQKQQVPDKDIQFVRCELNGIKLLKRGRLFNLIKDTAEKQRHTFCAPGKPVPQR